MKSASRVCVGVTHPGRPEDEEPHVKRTIKGKKEIAEYICKVDQVPPANCHGELHLANILRMSSAFWRMNLMT